jgi:hypothetical protein
MSELSSFTWSLAGGSIGLTPFISTVFSRFMTTASRSACSSPGAPSAVGQRFRHCGGKEDRESGAVTDFAFRGDAPIVLFDDAFHDGQSQTGAFNRVDFLLHAEEAFEDVRQAFFWNADAGVFYRNRNLARWLNKLHIDLDLAAVRCVLDGVGDQVDDRPFNGLAVHFDQR